MFKRTEYRVYVTQASATGAPETILIDSGKSRRVADALASLNTWRADVMRRAGDFVFTAEIHDRGALVWQARRTTAEHGIAF